MLDGDVHDQADLEPKIQCCLLATKSWDGVITRGILPHFWFLLRDHTAWRLRSDSATRRSIFRVVDGSLSTLLNLKMEADQWASEVVSGRRSKVGLLKAWEASAPRPV